ncbi:MAG: hypothetical protein RLZZ226_1789, partial [Pseudomonadota bacterium]
MPDRRDFYCPAIGLPVGVDSGNHIQPVHIGFQCIGDADTALGILVVFHDGNQGASYRQAGAVEGMYQLGFAGFSAAKTYDLEVWLPGQNAYREI